VGGQPADQGDSVLAGAVGRLRPGEAGGGLALDPGSLDARLTASSLADQWTRHAILEMVRESGGQISERPIYQGSSVTRPDAEPMAALRTIQHIQAATRHKRPAVHPGCPRGWPRLARHRRGAGPDRRDRRRRDPGGGGLHLRGRGSGQCLRPRLRPLVHLDLSVVRRGDPRPGPYSGPENDEEGHARDCSRLAAAAAEREAQWEAEA